MTHEDPGLASQLAEHVLHGKVKAIVAAEGIEYADALERVWYEPDNAELVEAYRGFSCDGENPEDRSHRATEPLSPFDAGLETGKRVRAHLSQVRFVKHETTPEAALNAVLAADAALKAAWQTDLKLGAD